MQPSDVLSADRYIAQVGADAARFAEVLDGVDPNTLVPTCPSWVVRDLVVHQGGIHRWATRIVAESRTERAFLNIDDFGGGPADDDLGEWFRSGAERLIETLAAAPDDLEAFTFVAAPNAKLHWTRRMAHEMAIHRVDAERVVAAPTGFDAEFAGDGLDELTVSFWKRPKRGPRAAKPTSVAFEPVDLERAWTTSFDAESVDTVRQLESADARVSGAASDLYVFAWNRPTIGRIHVIGDPAAVGRLAGDG